jgi:NitT/TauT family transport system substrate-binding protein
MTTPRIDRRAFTRTIGAAAAAAAFPGIGRAQARKLRVGYLHVLSVDAHLWLAQHLGSWKKEGLDVEFRLFSSGIELFQAMVGGSIDVLTTGGVLSNFPARGQGKVFLANSIEWATGQLWVNPKSGIGSIADLKGRKIATTRGTTAHDLLHQGLKSVGLDSNKDVEIVNQRMPDAVTSFVSEAVPAVATWVPYNVGIKRRLPAARLLFDGSSFPSAAIVAGWAARNDFYDKQKDMLRSICRAWIPANEFLMKDPEAAMAYLHKTPYADLSKEDMDEMYRAIRFFPTADWVRHYESGELARWLNQVTSFNVEVGAIENPIMADRYFDPSIFQNVAKTFS